MRFLLGLLLGAMLILLAAEALEGSGGPWVERASSMVDRASKALGERLFVRPQQVNPGTSQTAPAPAVAAAPAVPPLPAIPPLAAISPQPAAEEPIPRPPDPRPLDETGPEDIDSVVSEPDPGAGAAPERQSQSVWVPFHSERSASGFAGRLSESLDHPFLVERQGPGRYQVVFRYYDEPQRQALLARVSAVTGLPR